MSIQLIVGDCRTVLKTLPSESINCIISSPPYFALRNYGVDGQIGQEDTPQAFVETLVDVFRECRRVLRKDGTFFLNLGDTYAANRSYQVTDTKHVNVGNTRGMSAASWGLKPKDLIGIPWRTALALQSDGWWLRQDIIWEKPNVMPESIRDRCTRAHEYLFMFTKAEKYWYDSVAIKEPAKYANSGRTSATKDELSPKRKRNGTDGTCSSFRAITELRNKRSVWSINTQPFKGAHFAVFPEKLVEPCLLAGCPENGTVLDPFSGAGTVGVVAKRLNRNAILIDLNPDYCTMARARIDNQPIPVCVSRKQDSTGKATYTGFNERWKLAH